AFALAEDVGDAVAPRRLPGQPGGGVQRAAGEDVAVGRAVHQLDALAEGGELHGVLAHDVAGADRGEAGLCPTPRGGLAQRERGAGGRVKLARVVLVEDVAIPTR